MPSSGAGNARVQCKNAARTRARVDDSRGAELIGTPRAMLLLFAGSLLVWPLAYTWADDFFVSLPAPGTTTYVFFCSAYTFSAWCATLGLLGLVRAHHGLPTTWLSASSAAVEPFYLVHQPVIVRSPRS